jgi:hypothetical protein
MHEKLKPTAEALKTIEPCDWIQQPYENSRGVRGRYFEFWRKDEHHRISVHNCEAPLRPLQLADLIQGIEYIDDDRSGAYFNRRGVRGFYAVAKSQHAFNGTHDHWYMISRTPELDPAETALSGQSTSQDEIELMSYLNRVQQDPRFR